MPIRYTVASVIFALSQVAWAETQQIARVPVPNSNVPVSQAVWLPGQAATLYLSGMLPSAADNGTLGDTHAQTVSVLRRIEAALAGQGLSMADIIQLRVYLVGDPSNQNAMDFQGFQSGYRQFFATQEQPHTPVRTVVQVAGLALPGALVELEATAAKLK